MADKKKEEQERDEPSASEVADKFGSGAGRAEDLIESSRRRYGPELREAQLQQKDEQASDELDWGEAASAVDVDDDSVVDASVRGDYIVVTYEDEDGRLQKRAAARDEKKAAKKAEQAEKREVKQAEKEAKKAEQKAETKKAQVEAAKSKKD